MGAQLSLQRAVVRATTQATERQDLASSWAHVVWTHMPRKVLGSRAVKEIKVSWTRKN